MKTLRLCLLISAFCLVSVTKATASDFKVDGINYNITSSTDLTVEVTFEPGSYTNKLPYTKELTIPEYVTYKGKTYTVTSIGKKAFNNFAFSGSITIPASVTSIGDMAFSSCYNLTSITIPENSALTSIGEGAFDGCFRLTNSITLPASLTSIGNNAFRNCPGLTSITIPENSALTSIGDSTFYNCASIAYINIPEGVALIGDGAFYGCYHLTNPITLPASLTSIGDNAFRGCTGLTSITIPENSALTSIGDRAFSYCENLTFSIPENIALISIGEYAFYKCHLTNSITIPESMTSIGDGTFYGCDLTSITIPESVTSIGNEAFSFCRGLTSITIPASVTSIGDGAFSYCYGLTSITIPENSALTSIGDNAFRACTGLTSITIPESVTSIGDSAFLSCNGLSSVKFLGEVDEIGNDAFGSTAWYNNLPDGPSYIGKILFCYKGNAVDGIVEVAEGTTQICSQAFSRCTGLTEVKIPSSVISIRKGAFSGCQNLISITIPENSALTSIGDNAFSNCTGLTSITIPASVTSIGDNAFSGCTGLTSITIPASVTSIGDNAFSNCTGLASITIPASVTSIGDGAFSGCSSLTEITIQSVIPPTFGVDVFIGINAKAVLNYPKGSDYSVLKRYFSNFGAEHMNGNSWIVEDDGTAYVYPNGSYTLNGYSGSKTIKKVYAYGFNDIGGLNSPLLEEFYAFPLPGSPIILESVGWGAFNNCISLRTVSLQNGLTSIDGYAFAGCRNLKYIYLPVGLTYIGDAAFANTGIEFLVVPESVMYIGDFNNPANWVFMNPYGQTVMERLPDDLGYVYIPEGAVGYDNYNFPKEHNGYIVSDDKMFVFGNWGSISENIKKVEMTPDMGLLGGIRTLPSTVTFDILPGVTNNPDPIYTIEGSNAVFIGDELVAGRANSIIPKGTKRIGDGAFQQSGLTSIEIPESVTSIGDGAFSYCYGLTSITIPESVTSIGENAFYLCRSLTSLEIPNSVTFIGREAFWGCVGVDTIIVDEANPVYDSRDSCNAIIETQSNKLIFASKTVTIPSSVTSIGGYAFFPLVDMDITIPSTVTSFDNYAFYNTKNLYLESLTPPTIETEDGLIFGWGVIIVPSDAYESYCNADVWRYYKDIILTKEMAEYEIEASSTEGMSGVLNEVGVDEADRVVKLKVKGKINSYDITVMRDKMPNLQELDLSEATVVASKRPFYQTYCTGKNSLGSYAFYDLDNLVSVKLPKGLTSIGDCAFMGCDKLKSVDASLTEGLYMGEKTFYGCSNLQEFVAPQVISYIGSGSFVDCGSPGELHINRITGSILSNTFDTGMWKIEIDSIGGDICSNAFGFCQGLKEVKIGTLVGDLCDRAFVENDNIFGCWSLRHVEFARGPRRIGSNVFPVSELESFVAGEGLIEISDKAFNENTTLKRVVLPESIQKIGSKAFARCSSLSELYIPQSVTSIGKEAFLECSSLKSIEIPNGVTAIENGIFDGCSSLQSVVFPDGFTSIGSRAFYGCGFDTLKLPPTLRTIGESAFEYNNKLTELHIPSSLEKINQNAFNHCDKLNAVYTYTVEPTEITETTFSTFASAILYVPATSFWNYYWDIGWSRFDHKNFKEFNEPYNYFYLNGDYQLDSSTGYIAGTPDADLRPGSGLIVIGDESSKAASMHGEHARLATQRRDGGEATMMRLGNVNMESDGNGNSASVIGDSKLHVDTLNVRIDVKGGKWYFFTFPFDVPFSRITMQGGSGYIFRYYDSAQRAKNGNGGWKIVNDDYLKACQGYIFQSSADDVLILSAEKVQFDGNDKLNRLVTYQSSNLHDASWNFMGNPYLSYYDIANLDYTAPVTVWDGERYVAVRPGDDDYCFAPFEAFFVQKPQGKEGITFGFDNQLTKSQSLQSLSLRAESRRTVVASPDRQIVNLVFGDDENTDRTRVVFNSRASHDYETACDAAKFETAGVPQFYTIGGESVRYAINERPEGDGVVPIGYSVPNSGYYTIDVVRDDAEVFLYDAETKTEYFFEDGAYRFYSEKGEYNARLSLGIRSKAATEIETVDADDAVIAVEGGIEFKTYANAEVYNSAGMLVATQHGVGVVELSAGTYIVSIGNCNTKVVVK